MTMCSIKSIIKESKAWIRMDTVAAIIYNNIIGPIII